MSHRNARLTVHGRLLIVDRAQAGWKQAHIAASMGVSRRCVKRWLDRYRVEGEAGLHDRSSRPHRIANRTSDAKTAEVIAVRAKERVGRDEVAARTGVPPRTVSRIIARAGLPHLAELDPMTGERIRASKTTTVRYERERPGELVHMDVKKLGRIPDGGGWKAHGRREGSILRDRTTKVGFDYVHSVVDNHCRLAYSEVLPDEKGPTCAALLERAIGYFAAHGIPRIERLITDNAWAPSTASGRSSSNRTAPGRTARWRGLTGPCKPSGPTGSPSPRTMSAPQPLTPGSSTTTLDDATQPSEASPRSADCNQRPDRVHLEPLARQDLGKA